MKKLFAVVMTLVVALSLGASAVLAGQDVTGNGAPSGAHYNLNLVGVAKDKTADMTGSNGHVIFVKLEGQTRILLSMGEFMVLDANGTDGSASFQLPNPDPDNDGNTVYSVYARFLGKPTDEAGRITPGCTIVDGEEVLSVEYVTVERPKGKSSFENVSRQLLYVWYDIDADGDIDRVPLFDSRGEDYFWQYDNNGCKLVQLRFYEVSTFVGEDPEPIA
jgi:hypothetical protein